MVWYEESIENMKDAKPDKMYIDIGARSESMPKSWWILAIWQSLQVSLLIRMEW